MLTIDETIPPTDTTLGLKCFCGLDIRSTNGDPCAIINDIKNILEVQK